MILTYFYFEKVDNMVFWVNS